MALSIVVFGYSRESTRYTQKLVSVCVILSSSVYYFEVVLSESLEPVSHLTKRLLEVA